MATTEHTSHYPLLNIGQFPDFAGIQLEHIVPTFDQLLAEMSAEFTKREAEFTPTWEGTFGQVEELEDRLERTFGVIQHISAVKDQKIVRDAMAVIQPKVIELSLRMQQSRAMYDALQSMHTTQSAWSKLSSTQQRVVERRLQAMEQSGVALDPTSPERCRNDEIHQALSSLSLTFGNNLLDAIKKYGRLVEDKAQLAGCPDTLMRSMSYQAKLRGHGTGDAELGPWLITLDHPTIIPFMKYCTNEMLREEIHRANITKASTGNENNKPILYEILKLRQELAHLFGYQHYAEMSLVTKMAGNLDRATNLIESLRIAAYNHGEKELEQLTAFAEQKLNLPGPLQPWNSAFVSERYRESILQYDEEKVAEYFPFPRVLAGMFSLAEQLFGVNIREIERGTPGAPSVWHEDVKVFEIRDQKSERPIAYFYGDFYSRPEEKRSGAWMDSCATRWQRPNNLRLPVAYLICNQPAPLSANEASLMKYSDVTTLFHEFGHCLQHLLTIEDMPQVSGVTGIEWDFIEVASQFMENFCYEKDWLQALSGHVKTNEPLPNDIIDALQRERIFLSGLATQRQLLFSQIDLELHSTKVGSNVDWPFEVDRRISQLYKLPPRLAEDRFLCSFAHIFNGSYGAGYYSYKWSEVYSADAYAAFKHQRGDALKQVGQRYRDTVLALGGSTDPSRVWQLFLGRSEADVRPLLQQDGLL
ncbi:hypothetical protein BDF19DRAFT_498867 [Syncephalis fuscata]|nr:hypothetical protein BDF19DRAFT_498867 [Syncephalis fuscata]